ncbi:FAD dependent oxidoreductase [hydrothermal vent metagenome]|uniref:FAD dependent oxidoreductase n=1 Tax=hydrothermal vent metagenome TaxID=652676 RepID=A0A1W1CF92_9ZZZZ
MEYETIIIGSGIAGCSIGHFLQKYGQKVLILDRSAIAGSGGSGSAGAFVSPKIGKGSSLQTLTNEAYIFAKDFYLNNYPKYFHQTGVIRIPKDKIDALKFQEYKRFNKSQYKDIKDYELLDMGIKSGFDSFLFEDAGVCDAPLMCQEILSSIPHKQRLVEDINYIDGYWHIDEFKAKNIVLATGYENHLFDMRYMGVKGTWGSRGDYYSDLDLSVSMHQSISVSANINGVIKIGATHIKSKEPCMICDGKPLSSLEEKASLMVDSSDFKLKQTYCGMRAGSKDYFPLVGGVIDVEDMFKKYPKITRGERVKEPMSKIDNLYILNGLGGRGFVFAPLMAKILAEHIVNNREITKEINPDRLFLKWCRKLRS